MYIHFQQDSLSEIETGSVCVMPWLPVMPFSDLHIGITTNGETDALHQGVHSGPHYSGQFYLGRQVSRDVCPQ